MKCKFFLLTITVIIFNLNFVKAQVQTGVFKTPQENTDYHHFTRDNGGGAAVYINQVSTGPILRLSSGIFNPNQNVKFTFENNGRFGIGTLEPTTGFELKGVGEQWIYVNQSTIGGLRISSSDGQRQNVLYRDKSTDIITLRAGHDHGEISFIAGGSNTERMRIKADGNIDVYGTLTSKSFLSPQDNIDYSQFIRNNSGGAVVYLNQVSTGPIFRASSGTATPNSAVKFTIENNGGVGIGTVNLEDYMLAVNGKIRAKEIKVETGWADFVFDNNYNLRKIEEVEKFISDYKHLPDIPSAKEVEENGINLGEMDAKLLQKIEELTLYMIEQNKRIEKLEKENEILKTKLDIIQ